MKKLLSLIIVCIALAAAAPAPVEPIARPAGAEAVRFTFVDVFVDAGGAPLAVYQFELKGAEAVRIVGVESGAAKGFDNPPYYDPAALQNNRIIVGAFSTSADLPVGKAHVARLHLAIEGDVPPQFSVQLIVAGNAAGEKVPATVTFAEGATR